MTVTDQPTGTIRPSAGARPTALRGQLEPRTDAGRRLAAAVDELGPTMAARARANDADAIPPIESLADLRAIGYLRAAIPEAQGGLGVENVHDLVVVASRLARHDPSLAIGVNMHTVGAHSTTQAWHATVQAGRTSAADRIAGQLQLLAASGAAVAAVVSEPGGAQDLTRPATTASRDGDGWRIDGEKAFATMSPYADLLSVGLSFTDDDGEERYGFALVAPSAAGVTVHDDWDALGMRTSGSGRVTLDGVRIGPAELSDSHAAGTPTTAALNRYVTSGLFHASATLGIAESAHLQILGGSEAALARMAAPGRARQLVADNVIDLRAMAATLARAADRVDDHLVEARCLGADQTLDAATDAFAEAQTAKALIGQAGPRVVDRALELTGGAGYLTKHPLSQAYRDVRAGAFMHPYGANRAFDLIAQVELGQVPDMA
jgi:alkylation response protein AidB-like acyl-CoA dehydrogenase